jgi:hypothetical protein
MTESHMFIGGLISVTIDMDIMQGGLDIIQSSITLCKEKPDLFQSVN